MSELNSKWILAASILIAATIPLVAKADVTDACTAQPQKCVSVTYQPPAGSLAEGLTGTFSVTVLNAVTTPGIPLYIGAIFLLPPTPRGPDVPFVDRIVSQSIGAAPPNAIRVGDVGINFLGRQPNDLPGGCAQCLQISPVGSGGVPSIAGLGEPVSFGNNGFIFQHLVTSGDGTGPAGGDMDFGSTFIGVSVQFGTSPDSFESLHADVLNLLIPGPDMNVPVGQRQALVQVFDPGVPPGFPDVRVPEPTTLALFGTGLIYLGLIRRRRINYRS
jgi:hypothetical protein